ncbi:MULTISPECIES: hypothetical protein [unclassified Paenibacillus]|nr:MULTISPECIES: hypothetical protein [unclassified Paenibacillus]MBU5442043.1 hypothetical protein [Paenibacillus sp. MSJ-34]
MGVSGEKAAAQQKMTTGLVVIVWNRGCRHETDTSLAAFLDNWGMGET